MRPGAEKSERSRRSRGPERTGEVSPPRSFPGGGGAGAGYAAAGAVGGGVPRDRGPAVRGGQRGPQGAGRPRGRLRAARDRFIGRFRSIEDGSTSQARLLDGDGGAVEGGEGRWAKRLRRILPEVLRLRPGGARRRKRLPTSAARWRSTGRRSGGSGRRRRAALWVSARWCEELLMAILAEGHCLDHRGAGAGQDPHGEHHRRAAVPGIQAHPVHPRPDALGHHRSDDHLRGGRLAAGPQVPQGADLLQRDPRRRDQPHPRQDPGGPHGGHGGAPGHRRRDAVRSGAAVLRAGHREPHRAGGHLLLAGLPDRPVHVQRAHRLPQPQRGVRDPPADHLELPGPDGAAPRPGSDPPGHRRHPPSWWSPSPWSTMPPG